MTRTFLLHDHSIILTFATAALCIAGDVLLYFRARAAAAVCALAGFALIAANLAIGRPFDIEVGPFVGIEPLPVVSDVEGFARLALFQTGLLAAAAYVLISAVAKERPRLF